MKLSRQQPAMYLAAFLYVFSLYRFTDIYVRGALGEVLAFVFMPVALIGIYEVLWGDEKKWSWLMTGYSGLLLSHTLSFYLMVLILIVFILIRWHVLNQQRQRGTAITKAALWAIGLCSFLSVANAGTNDKSGSYTYIIMREALIWHRPH